MKTSSQTTLEACQSPSFSEDLFFINQVVCMHIDVLRHPYHPPPPPPKKYITPSSRGLKIEF